MSPTLRCTSAIERVVVYSRGALITRRVDLPEPAPAERVDLLVPGLSPLAQHGAFRADTAGARLVLGVRPQLVIPEHTENGGKVREKLRELKRERQRIEARRAEIQARREGLLALTPRPALNGRHRRADPKGRFGDTLAVSCLVEDLTRELDVELEKVDTELEANARSRVAARLELVEAVACVREIAAACRLWWDVTVHLDAGPPIRSFELSYPVAAARWWPAYSARIGAGATTAQLSLEAFVAQATLEDWTGVDVSLCTADMAAEARLPELPSLRIGRAQPPRKTGFRPPPEGLDALFAGYDAATTQPTPPAAPAPGGPEATSTKPLKAKASSTESFDIPCFHRKPTAPEVSAEEVTQKPMHAMARPAPSVGRSRNSVASLDETARTCAAPRRPSDRDSTEIDVESWLDFDALALPAPSSPRRGRLVPTTAAERTGRLVAAAERAITKSCPVGPVVDVLHARGEFDHRFDAAGAIDVPPNGIPVRILLATADAPLTTRSRTVPREGTEVYREATLTNPFAAPLLGGPMEVFVDGALLATFPIAPVGPGGPLVLGMGVEDRLRVARNVRAEEESKGLLGGTTAVHHEVSVDAVSALGHDVELEVFERIPVTDEKDVTVTLTSSEPKAERYDQSDRAAPLRGGVYFKLAVPAGGKARLAFTYRIELPAKMELVGGNRRD